MDRARAEVIIKETVIRSVKGFAKKKLSKKAKFQILDLLIPRERKIRSIVGGLETSLGTTLWEPLAKSLASENGFEVINRNLDCPSNMPSSLNNALQMITDDRRKQGGLYSAASSKNEIIRVCQSFLHRPIESFEAPPRGKGVDVWLCKDGVNYFFDTKTVQPNISTLSGCVEQVIYWYAYFYAKYPEGASEGRIVFPYNPNPEKSFWDGVIGGGLPLEAGTEAWVQDEFWDFCSGLENTYSSIVKCFRDISKSKVLEDTLRELLD